MHSLGAAATAFHELVTRVSRCNAAANTPARQHSTAQLRCFRTSITWAFVARPDEKAVARSRLRVATDAPTSTTPNETDVVGGRTFVVRKASPANRPKGQWCEVDWTYGVDR